MAAELVAGTWKVSATNGRSGRVLFLAPYLGDGGINTHMLTLGSELLKIGWDVGICSGGPHLDPAHVGSLGRRSGAPGPGDYERAGIPHFHASIPASPHRLQELPQLLRIPLTFWQVLRAIRGFRPDIIHSHSRQMGLYARVAQLLLGIPFVSSVHSPVMPRNRLWAATTFLGSRVIAVSEEVRAGLIRDYRARPDRVQVIPPAADVTRFRPPSAAERERARERWGLGPDVFAVAFVGSLTSNKHPETLVEAVAALSSAGRDVVALVAGRGPAEDAARARAADLGAADRVHFLGYQDPVEVLWAADAFVLPSRSEGSPLVVVEAMLSGVVVVATPAGGASQQLTTGVTGMLFEHGSARELASRLDRLLVDPAHRADLAARALVGARERYSSALMARRVAEAYAEVLRDRTLAHRP